MIALFHFSRILLSAISKGKRYWYWILCVTISATLKQAVLMQNSVFSYFRYIKAPAMSNNCMASSWVLATCWGQQVKTFHTSDTWSCIQSLFRALSITLTQLAGRLPINHSSSYYGDPAGITNPSRRQVARFVISEQSRNYFHHTGAEALCSTPEVTATIQHTGRL